MNKCVDVIMVTFGLFGLIPFLIAPFNIIFSIGQTAVTPSGFLRVIIVNSNQLLMVLGDQHRAHK